MKKIITATLLLLTLNSFSCHRHKQVPIPKIDVLKWMPEEREISVQLNLKDILSNPVQYQEPILEEDCI